MKGITCSEAGRLGGKKCRENHETEWYQENGHRGGTAVMKKYGKEHFRKLGKKGGRATAAKKTQLANG